MNHSLQSQDIPGCRPCSWARSQGGAWPGAPAAHSTWKVPSSAPGTLSWACAHHHWCKRGPFCLELINDPLLRINKIRLWIKRNFPCQLAYVGIWEPHKAYEGIVQRGPGAALPMHICLLITADTCPRSFPKENWVPGDAGFFMHFSKLFLAWASLRMDCTEHCLS